MRILSDKIDAMSPQARPLPRAELSLREAVAALLTDLFFAAHDAPERWSYGLQRPMAFKGEKVGYRAFRRASDGLKALGYIVAGNASHQNPWGSSKEGSTAATTKSGKWGKTARFRATPDLFKLAKASSVSPEDAPRHFRIGLPKAVLQLRLPKSPAERRSSVQRAMLVDYEETEETRRIASDVRHINAFLAQHELWKCPHVGFRRIFSYVPHAGWTKQGRRYSIGWPNYQLLPQERRLEMLIDGEPVAEIDVSACALTILFAMLKEPLDPSSAYDVPGIPRHVIKSWVTITLGHTKFHDRWTTDAGKAFSETCPHELRTLGDLYPIKTVEALVLAKHPLLRRYHQSGFTSLDNMFIESEIIVRTVVRLIDEWHVPSLPVHDSLIVRKRDVSSTVHALEGEFLRRTGVLPRTKVN